MREIRKPSVSKKINDALRQVPPSAATEMESIIRGTCLKYLSVNAGTKGANSYKRAVLACENWADGYVTGTGRECVIVSGSYAVPSGAASLGLTPVTTRQLVFVVHDPDEFLRILRDICAVASVQLS